MLSTIHVWRAPYKVDGLVDSGTRGILSMINSHLLLTHQAIDEAGGVKAKVGIKVVQEAARSTGFFVKGTHIQTDVAVGGTRQADHLGLTTRAAND